MLQAPIQLYRTAFSGIPKEVWLQSLVMLINRSGTMVIPFLTVYLTEQGYTLAQAGTVMAAFGVGAFLGGFIGGKLTDKFGFFHIQFISLLLNGIFFIVLGFMQGLVQITVCVLFLSTLGEAFRPANAAAIGAYSNETNRTRSYSLNRLAVNLGWAVGPAVGGLLASINYSLLFWADGLTCITAALLLYVFLAKKKPPQNEENSSKTTQPTASVYKDAVFIKGMFFIFLISFSFFQLFSIIPVFYKEQVHLSEAMIGVILAANGLIIALVEMILVFYLEQKNNPVRFMIYGALLIGASFLVLALPPVLFVVVLSMLIVTSGEMLLFPFTNTFWVSRTTAYNRGQYAGVYTMAFAVAQVLAPILSSRIAISLGFKGLFVIDFFLCSLGAFGFFWLLQQKGTHGKF